MNKFLDLKPTERQLIDWDIPSDYRKIKERFSGQLEKFGEDQDFFFAVYSVAASDWYEKKSQGKKVGGLSGHFSTYLKKETKRISKGRDILTKLVELKEQQKSTVPSPADKKVADTVLDLNSIPEFEDDESLPDTEPPFPIETQMDTQTNTSSGSDPFPVENAMSSDPILNELEPSDDSDLNEPSSSLSSLSNDEDSSDNSQDLEESENVSSSESSVSSLSLLDDEEDEDYEDDLIGLEEIEDEGFEKEKRKRSTMMTVIIISFVVLIGAGLIMSVLAKAFEEQPKEEAEPIPDYSEYKKGRVESVSASLNKGDKQELTDSKPLVESKPEKKRSGGFGSSSGHSGKPRKNMNTKKDEEILAQYADESDPAASGSGYAGGARAGRTHFVPGGTKQQGGVYYRGREKKNDSKGGTFQLHNKKVRVRLEFSIRSTAPSTVVAIVKEGSDKIPKGAKFYGRASGYVNKRTQIRFNKLIIGENSFQVNGFAISGRDPGIESEVTDISKNNIGASIKQGVAKTASGIVQKYAGTIGQTTGDAASNTADPTAAEIEKQQEAQKLTEEYRVPAGTSFYIYLE